MARLDGRTALVTGGAGGVGKATARRLACEGAAVAVADLRHEPGTTLAEEIEEAGGRAVFLDLDVTDPEGWTRAVQSVAERFGGLDVLVNNAGLGDDGPLEETDVDTYHRVVAVAQTSVFLGMKAAAELLKASPAASVVNVGSLFGASGGFGTAPAHHAAEGAVRLLTKNTALHWARHGVRVNSVHPGFVESPFLGEGDRAPLVEATPLGRLGEPAEIAAAIAFLACDDSSFVTGSALCVDGGFTAR